MLKRVLKPNDTHLMAPDEEYCRVIYERQWNAPDVFNLSIELFDKGGVRVRKNYQKITAQTEQEIIRDILGDGWETIFTQDYEDWMIRCQKRPRSASQHGKYLPKTPSNRPNSFWRQLVIGGLGVFAIALVMGWVSGRFPQTASIGNELATSTSSESDNLGYNNLGSDSLNSDNLDSGSLDSDNLDASNPEPDTNDDSIVGIEENADGEDGGDGGDRPQSSTEPVVEPSREGSEPVTSDPPTSTASEGTDPFILAVRVAQQAVVAGRDAETQAEWEALAVRWQEAADLMADVSSDDDRYDIAQDRVDVYEANRDVALSEAEKASAN